MENHKSNIDLSSIMGKSGKPNKERSSAPARGRGRGRGRGGSSRGRGAPRGAPRSDVPVYVTSEFAVMGGADGR